ncbi:MAG: ATP-dependent DNA helicase RecQ [Bdellovibrionales bacterium]
MTPIEVLKNVFGYETFRGVQKEVIEEILAGHNSLALMPTGQGKSLCFQIPARLMSGGTTLVLSPLIALMKDQVDQARKKGFRAAFINSSLTKPERLKRYEELSRGEYELVYVTPERFNKADFLEALRGVKISLLAIDEAHCISEWGHDFRPDYTRIKEFREILGNPTTLAVTATATPRVQLDIIKQMGLTESEVQVFRSGIERENLSLEVHDVHGLDEKVRSFIGLRHQSPGVGICYFSLISTLESFSRAIDRLGIPHVVYHGQLRDDRRRRNQENFLRGDADLILATPAFGLGIDKADVRLIIHGETPGSLEAYYQEAGRAGRDGLESRCALLYDPDDISIQEDFIKWAHPDPGFIKTVYELIRKNPLRFEQEGADFLRQQMNYYNSRDYRVETTLNLLKRWSFLEEEGGVLRASREPEGDLLSVEKNDRRLKDDKMRLLEMVRYATATSCRAQMIYQYFGDTEAKACGKCDRCLGTD